MAVVPHLRVTWGGTLGPVASPREVWSTGVNMGGDSPLVSLPSTAEMDAIVAAVANFHASGTSGIGPAAVLRQVVMAYVLPTGKVGRREDGAFLQDKRAINPLPGASTNTYSHPWQVSWVATLQSNRSGPTGRGRMYLPAPRVQVEADGLATEQGTEDALAAVTALLRALDTAVPSLRPVVVSSGSQSQGLPPVNSPVTSVRMGRRLDVLRTRANALEEGYRTLAL